jgi:hypothetical protein
MIFKRKYDLVCKIIFIRGIFDVEYRFILKSPAFAAILVLLLLGCGDNGGEENSPSTSTRTRTWQMGFYYTPPRLNVPLALQNIDLFSARAEIAMIHEELPWEQLLAAESAGEIVDALLDDILNEILDNDKSGLVDYLRGKGLRIFFMADLTDGLSRGQEPPKLRELHRSITEPVVQQLYRNYLLAFVDRFQPDYIGLTAETNLVRQMAQSNVYAAVVKAANDAAMDLHNAGVTAPLLVSVQVETAWGRLDGSGSYVGIEQDFTDFPFIQVLGLSSYPYFGFEQPEDIPDNYYSRLLNGRSLPVMVCEGGWAGADVLPVTSSPQEQARYITRHAGLLDSINAHAVIQTLFTDLDLESLTEPYPDNLPLFSSLGLMQLVGDDFEAKPALTAWDELFALPGTAGR